MRKFLALSSENVDRLATDGYCRFTLAMRPRPTSGERLELLHKSDSSWGVYEITSGSFVGKIIDAPYEIGSRLPVKERWVACCVVSGEPTSIACEHDKDFGRWANFKIHPAAKMPLPLAHLFGRVLSCCPMKGESGWFWEVRIKAERDNEP